MNARDLKQLARVTLAGAALLALLACGTAPKKDLALEQVKNQLTELKADEDLASYAPSAIGEAERALRQAESSTGSDVQRAHLIYMADRRIQIARAIAQHEQLQEEYIRLSEERNEMLVQASHLEAEQARLEAEQARMMSLAREEDAARAARKRKRLPVARPRPRATPSRPSKRPSRPRCWRPPAPPRRNWRVVRPTWALEQANSLRRQLENLQLRQTESGVVVTLGDVLFETGQTELRTEALDSLVEVVDLLQSEPEKNIRIEGHTDSSGPEETNLRISQARADSVLEALVSLGVDAQRITSVGMGEDFPIATNDTEEGKAQNRRVDVILLDD